MVCVNHIGPASIQVTGIDQQPVHVIDIGKIKLQVVIDGPISLGVIDL
jgi:hypothetical protein